MLAGLSLLLPSTPTYDPFAWLSWGREIASADLDTRGGPAWKPLPVLLTTPFSLTGDAAPYLWLAVARAGGLMALVMAFRVARRLAGGSAGIVAGVFAALALALTSSPGLIRHTALGNSEGLLVALGLMAMERHLAGHRRQALLAGFAAALLRPEVWPFVGLYGVYLWFVEPATRWLVAGVGAAIPALWFLPELWGSGDLLRGSARAQAGDPGNPAFADQPALEILERSFESRAQRAGQAGALVAVGFAVAGWVRARREAGRPHEDARPGRSRFAGRRWPSGADGAVLLLFAVALAWLAIAAVMAEAGYAGDARYLVVTVACGAILGGVGIARVAQWAGGWLAARAHGKGGNEGEPETARPARAVLHLGRPATEKQDIPPASASRALKAEAAIALLLLIAAVPFVVPRVRELPDVFDELQYDAALWDDAGAAIAKAGGRDAVLRCGRPYTAPYEVQLLAWELDVPSSRIGLDPRPPGAVFRTHIFRTPGSPPPRLEPDVGRTRAFRPAAAAGEWEVLTSCRSRPNGSLRSGAASGNPAAALRRGSRTTTPFRGFRSE